MDLYMYIVWIHGPLLIWSSMSVTSYRKHVLQRWYGANVRGRPCQPCWQCRAAPRRSLLTRPWCGKETGRMPPDRHPLKMAAGEGSSWPGNSPCSVISGCHLRPWNARYALWVVVAVFIVVDSFERWTGLESYGSWFLENSSGWKIMKWVKNLSRTLILPSNWGQQLIYELCIQIEANLAHLERAGLVTRKNNYQAIINSVVQDMRNQRVHRQQRKYELMRLKATLRSLAAKRTFYEEQVSGKN